MKLVAFFVTAFLGVAIADPEAAVDKLVQSNIKFSAQLYKNIANHNPKSNFVFSPLAVQQVLALIRTGANGITAQEITASLGLPNQEDTETALGQILPALSKQANNLNILTASGIYVADGFEMRKQFVETANSVFNTEIKKTDFGVAGEAAKDINEWIYQQTDNIFDMIDESDLDEDTNMILLNAVYFFGAFLKRYNWQNTRKGRFYPTGTTSKIFDMMSQENDFNLYQCNCTKAKFLELEYEDRRFTMTIVLPNDIDGLEWMERRMTNTMMPKKYTKKNLLLEMPKFAVESTLKLAPILEQMGIKTAFSSEADLGGMSYERTRIDDIIQKTSIDINESGTTGGSGTSGKLAYFVDIGNIGIEKSASFSWDETKEFVFLFAVNKITGFLCYFLNRTF